MKLPESIKIGGHVWKVVFPYIFTERMDRYGDCNYSGKVIRITDTSWDEPRAESAIITTFIHEMFHAMDYTTGQDIFYGGEGEKKLEGLSEVIYQVIVDNPGVFNWNQL